MLNKNAIGQKQADSEAEASETATLPKKAARDKLNNDGTHKRYICYSSKCNKTFKRVSLLWKHLKMHAKNGHSYVCSKPGCGRSFTDKRRLEIHEEIHW